MDILRRTYWYKVFRWAALANTFVALVWTVLIILPFSPFSYAQPIIVAGGPGIWLTIAYVLYIAVGAGGFGWLSGLLFTIEVQENRTPHRGLLFAGFALLFAGVNLACFVLAYAGASGGYASTIRNVNGVMLSQILQPFVYPVSALVLVTVAGAGAVLLALIRARGP